MSRAIGVPEPVHAYVQRWGVREHPALAQCRRDTLTEPGARMQIEPEQGALMQVLAKAVRARRALEVGVFTGYSSTAVALALREIHGETAELIACDISEAFVAKARSYWRAAGVDSIIRPRIGPAAETLRALIADGRADDFDLMFIDADKTGYRDYYELGLTLLRPGGLILLDNMLWSGAVADPADTDADTTALRELAAFIHADPRVDETLATVGDGVSLVVKR